MQVILLKDVPKLGKRGEIKTVTDGYALNFLIPRALAAKATDNKIKQQADKALKEEEKKKKERAGRMKQLAKLKGLKVKIEAKISDSGKLFAGVNRQNLAAAINKQTGLELKENVIKLDKPFKETGEFEVEVDLGDDIKTIIKVAIKGVK